jgi:hypothetical protein
MGYNSNRLRVYVHASLRKRKTPLQEGGVFVEILSVVVIAGSTVKTSAWYQM